MEWFKNLLNKLGTLISSAMPWMSAVTWMGTLAFAFGFFVGSEGEWEGTLFFTLFWVVGAFIAEQYRKMR